MSMRLRLATYDVQRLTHGTAKVAGVLRSLSADIVCIQETPRWLRWRSRCAALARQAGLVYVTGDRTGAGTMLLSSHRVLVAHREEFPLPRTPGMHAGNLAVAVFTFTGGQQLVVGSMHLGRQLADRLRHVDLMVSRLESLGRKHGAPYVLAGHVGERQGGVAWKHLASVLTDGHAVAPRGGSATYGRTARVDGIFTSDDLRVVGCGVPDVSGLPTATGHRPVVADVELPYRPAA